MATVFLTGNQGLISNSVGNASTDFNKGILSGYAVAGDFKSSWTGSAFQYVSGYTFPDSGILST